jgi:L-amino acid N-acyltransferase
MKGKNILTIRKATAADVPVITEIYNEAILTTTATFDTQPKTSTERMAWFEEHDQKHPVLVAECNGKVAGWASISEWSSRQAYANTAELSVYVKSAFRNQGIGKQLITNILAAGQNAGLHTILSRIVEGNDSSIHLHEINGFTTVGIMREVGYKFDKLQDVRIMQLLYSQENQS